MMLESVVFLEAQEHLRLLPIYKIFGVQDWLSSPYNSEISAETLLAVP